MLQLSFVKLLTLPLRLNWTTSKETGIIYIILCIVVYIVRYFCICITSRLNYLLTRLALIYYYVKWCCNYCYRKWLSYSLLWQQSRRTASKPGFTCSIINNSHRFINICFSVLYYIFNKYLNKNYRICK